MAEVIVQSALVLAVSFVAFDDSLYKNLLFLVASVH